MYVYEMLIETSIIMFYLTLSVGFPLCSLFVVHLNLAS